MADQDIFHTAELVRAAIPFVDNRTQGFADLFVKVCDLMGSVKSVKNTQNLAACGFAFENIDIEGLLAAVRPVCNKRERDIVDRILNLFHMKKMFEMYNSMMETMKNMQDLGGFSFGDMNQDDTSNIFNNFSSNNFESIFQTIKAFTGQSTNDNTESTSSNQSNPDDLHNADGVYAAEMKNDHSADMGYGDRTDSDGNYDSDHGYDPETNPYHNYEAETYYKSGADTKNNFQVDLGNENENNTSDNNSSFLQETNAQMDQTVADILRDIKSAAASEYQSNNSIGAGSGFGSYLGSGSGSNTGSPSSPGSSSGSDYGTSSSSGNVSGSDSSNGSSSSSGNASGSSSSSSSSNASGPSSSSSSSNASGPSSSSSSSNDSGPNSSSTSGSSTGSGSSPTPMLDLLKTMVPSDKQSTFENLSMLFNSMSYDNSSKTDDRKGE